MGRVKLSSLLFIHAHCTRKIISKWNRNLITWLEVVCLGMWREAVIEEGRLTCFAGMLLVRKQVAMFIAVHFEPSTMHAITEVRDVSE